MAAGSFQLAVFSRQFVAEAGEEKQNAKWPEDGGMKRLRLET
jgi:hypothetical protein